MILFVSGEYPPDVGGVGDYTARLRGSLAGRGWPSHVVSRRQVRRWNARALVWFLRNAPRTGVLHIQFQAGAFDLLGDICVVPWILRRARPRLRCVTTFHDVRVPYLFPRAGTLRPAAVRLLARTSHAVIAADERDLKVLGGPSRRHFHIPIGPNVACAPPDGYDRVATRAAMGLEPDDLAIVYFGMLNASKGVDLLLDTFECIAAQQPRARMLLLGGEAGASDPTDRLTAARLAGRIERLGPRVVRTGWLPAPQLSAHLLAGDVAVLPFADGASARRGSLLACAEHGLPSVSTRPAGVEVAAFVEAVEPRPDALAEAALRVAHDPARLKSAGQALAKRMSWGHIAARHIELYDLLMRAQT
jgi:glycosyltransferase involved in cell wall biosynthesis